METPTPAGVAATAQLPTRPWRLRSADSVGPWRCVGLDFLRAHPHVHPRGRGAGVAPSG